MEKTIILFGSSTGNTAFIAKQIAKKMEQEVKLANVSDVNISDIQECKNLILGTSTWGVGDLQDDWDEFLPKLAQIDLAGKNIALFGLGDAMSYPDSFVDGMGIIYDKIKEQSCSFIGKVAADGYDYDDSRAVFDGKFVGLPIDEDNESDKTEERIDQWLLEIKPHL